MVAVVAPSNVTLEVLAVNSFPFSQLPPIFITLSPEQVVVPTIILPPISSVPVVIVIVSELSILPVTFNVFAPIYKVPSKLVTEPVAVVFADSWKVAVPNTSLNITL